MASASKGITPAKTTVTLKPGEPHAHGCDRCGLRYEDSCRKPNVNATCSACRSGFDRAVWAKDRDPRDCCYNEPQRADVATRQRHNLGGDGAWFVCRTCTRTHPYKPVRAPGGTG